MRVEYLENEWTKKLCSNSKGWEHSTIVVLPQRWNKFHTHQVFSIQSTCRLEQGEDSKTVIRKVHHKQLRSTRELICRFLSMIIGSTDIYNKTVFSQVSNFWQKNHKNWFETWEETFMAPKNPGFSFVVKPVPVLFALTSNCRDPRSILICPPMFVANRDPVLEPPWHQLIRNRRLWLEATRTRPTSSVKSRRTRQTSGFQRRSTK